MDDSLVLLSGLALSIGFSHTFLGPDHYLPFLALGRARRWTLSKTLTVTLLCGLGHILSSVLIGVLGIALGLAVFKLERFESSRGNIAAWLLTAFGLAYLLWGLRTAQKKKSHVHSHPHGDGTFHEHEHTHLEGHSHVHLEDGRANVTPWVLFIIFVFGPCEPLIPVLMFPASRHNWVGVIWITILFGLSTILTMLLLVVLGHRGLARVRLGRLEAYSHALSGLAIFLTGLSVQLLGL